MTSKEAFLGNSASPFSIESTALNRGNIFTTQEDNAATFRRVTASSFNLGTSDSYNGIFDSNHPLTLKDVNGTTETFTLTGAGYGEVTGTGTTLDRVNYFNTTADTSAAITTSGNQPILSTMSVNLVNGALKVLTSDNNINFGDYTGPSFEIITKGSISGGNINITSPNPSITGEQREFVRGRSVHSPYAIARLR